MSDSSQQAKRSEAAPSLNHDTFTTFGGQCVECGKRTYSECDTCGSWVCYGCRFRHTRVNEDVHVHRPHVGVDWSDITCDECKTLTEMKTEIVQRSASYEGSKQ